MEAPRKILFKAKRLNNKEWIEGYYVVINNLHLIYNDEYSDEYSYYEIDPTTLSQFTGWKDNHVNRIFENDIVDIISSPKRSYKYLIWWSREMNMMEAVPLDGIERNGSDYYNHKYYKFNYSEFCLMMQDPWGDFSDIKVIGNIFDNPELLERG